MARFLTVTGVVGFEDEPEAGAIAAAALDNDVVLTVDDVVLTVDDVTAGGRRFVPGVSTVSR